MEYFYVCRLFSIYITERTGVYKSFVRDSTNTIKNFMTCVRYLWFQCSKRKSEFSGRFLGYWCIRLEQRTGFYSKFWWPTGVWRGSCCKKYLGSSSDTLDDREDVSESAESRIGIPRGSKKMIRRREVLKRLYSRTGNITHGEWLQTWWCSDDGAFCPEDSKCYYSIEWSTSCRCSRFVRSSQNIWRIQAYLFGYGIPHSYYRWENSISWEEAWDYPDFQWHDWYNYRWRTITWFW